jgi:hypothetical protein
MSAGNSEGKQMNAPMISREVIAAAAERPETEDTWKNLVAEGEAAGMHQRDLRDLLVEFGCPGVTASELVSGR